MAKILKSKEPEQITEPAENIILKEKIKIKRNNILSQLKQNINQMIDFKGVKKRYYIKS